MTENEAKACAMLARVCGTLGEIMKAVEPLEKQPGMNFMTFVADTHKPATARSIIRGCLTEVQQAIEQLGKPPERPHSNITVTPGAGSIGNPYEGNQWGGQLNVR